MSQDASKFDTAKLLDGVENSDAYGLEDIMQEFHGEGRETPLIPEVTETPENKAQEQPQESVAQEPEALPYESLSESEIASAIAQAVASSFQGEAEPPIQLIPVEEPERDPEEPPEEVPQSAENAPQQAAPPEPIREPGAHKQKSSANIRKKKKKRRKTQNDAAPTPEPVQVPEEAPVPPPSAPQRVASEAPQPPKAQQVTGQGSNNPGTVHVKIPKSDVPKTSTAENLAAMISDVRRRQQAALPAPGTSLRGTEKRLSMVTGVDRVLSPVRYVILALMVFCLAGRKYAWMSLGFMGGINGTFVALILTIVSFLVCWKSVYRAIRDAVYLRPSYETYLLVATLLTMTEALVTKNEATLLPLLTIAWSLSGTANLLESQGNLRALRAVITGRGRVGVRVAAGKWEHTDCIGRAPASTQGFVRRQAQPDVWHTGNSILYTILFLVCLVASAYLSAKTKSGYLTVLVTLLDVGMPVSLVLCCARPYEMLCRALAGKGAVSGWFGMKNMAGKKAVLIYDSDLFPKETIGHKGIRVLSNQTPRLLASYGASLVLRANIGLSDVFTRLLRETDGELYDVAYFKSQEGGLEGRIHGNLVQVGSYQYMQLMGMTFPGKASRNSVYIAINGELSGVFSISYKVHAGAVSGFRRFVREPRLTPLVVTRNFCVNPAFIESWFKAPVNQIACPKAETRRALSEPSVVAKGTICGFTLRQGVGAYSRMVSGARSVYRMGLWYTIFSSLLTIVLTVRTMMALAAGTPVISGPRLLLLQVLLFLAVEIGARVTVRK